MSDTITLDNGKVVRCALLLDDSRGIYIPQGFAQDWAHVFSYPDNPAAYAEDVAILASGPHTSAHDADVAIAYHEAQDEAWQSILDNAVGTLFAPAGGWQVNPYAGWVLDQGSAEDGCVRAYHPDDRDALFGEG